MSVKANHFHHLTICLSRMTAIGLAVSLCKHALRNNSVPWLLETQYTSTECLEFLVGHMTRISLFIIT